MIVTLTLLANAVMARSPEAAVQSFLAWDETARTSGAFPTAGQPELRRLISGELSCLIDAAVTANAEAQRAAPDEKPPFAEGNLFLPSAWERPLSHALLSAEQNGRRAVVKVRFKYEPALEFVSVYSLRLGDGVWRIIDIAPGGTCDFCQSGELRASMYATLREYPKVNTSMCRYAGTRTELADALGAELTRVRGSAASTLVETSPRPDVTPLRGATRSSIQAALGQGHNCQQLSAKDCASAPVWIYSFHGAELELTFDAQGFVQSADWRLSR